MGRQSQLLLLADIRRSRRSKPYLLLVPLPDIALSCCAVAGRRLLCCPNWCKLHRNGLVLLLLLLGKQAAACCVRCIVDIASLEYLKPEVRRLRLINHRVQEPEDETNILQIDLKRCQGIACILRCGIKTLIHRQNMSARHHYICNSSTASRFSMSKVSSTRSHAGDTWLALSTSACVSLRPILVCS